MGDWSRCKKPISVCNQPPRLTQPGRPSMGRCSENQPKAGDALRLQGSSSVKSWGSILPQDISLVSWFTKLALDFDFEKSYFVFIPVMCASMRILNLRSKTDK